MTSSISLPSDRKGARRTASVVSKPLSRQAIAPLIQYEYEDSEARHATPYRGYGSGLLHSFSVYVNSAGLRLAAEKSLAQLFEDIERYALEPARDRAFDDYMLHAIDVDLTDTQVWTAQTYTLVRTPDASIPLFPEEDFEG